MVHILATLEILPPKDEMGNVVVPELVVTEGLTRYASRFFSERVVPSVSDFDSLVLWYRAIQIPCPSSVGKSKGVNRGD